MVTLVEVDKPLGPALDWIKAKTAALAADRALHLYGRDAIQKKNVTVYVDRKINRPIDSVRLWGEILFVPAIGPVQEAIQLAWDVAQAGAPHVTGHYASSFMFYVNGRPTGQSVPDLERERMGRRGNVQLANLAPYASMREIQVPRGVLYAAFNAVRRTFGRRVAVEYGYKSPAGVFAPNAGGPYAQTRKRPLNIPVLTIGSPASNVAYRGTRPGVAARLRKSGKSYRRKRRAKR